MSGTSSPRSSRRWRISGTAWAASSLLTVIRTFCDPASKSSATCCAVAAASAVSVLVIDWTTTGAAEPTATPRTRTVTVGRRGRKVLEALLGTGRRGKP